MLRGIDLAVAEHAAVALIGASGSGKSTLLRCIDLLEEIDDGDVLLDGEVITDPSRRPGRASAAGSAWSSRRFNLFPHLSVLENVTLAPVRAHGASRARRPQARARELLARFGLEGREDDHPDRPLRRPAAARGDRPRAGDAARARCCSTRSPARSTPSSSARCSTAIRELKAEGMTMLIATHEMGFAREVADEVCFLHEGVIARARRARADLHRARAARDPALPAPAAARRPALRRRSVP